jgi:hypothetical protein
MNQVLVSKYPTIQHPSFSRTQSVPHIAKIEKKDFHGGVLGNRHYHKSVYVISVFFEFSELHHTQCEDFSFHLPTETVLKLFLTFLSITTFGSYEVFFRPNFGLNNTENISKKFSLLPTLNSHYIAPDSTVVALVFLIKVAVRSANKERQNPIKGRKKCTGCAIFVPFLLLLCVHDTNCSCHITATLKKTHRNGDGSR